jgi:hypothetical protein
MSKYVDKATRTISRYMPPTGKEFTALDYFRAAGSLSAAAIDSVKARFPIGSTILEIGGGLSTVVLCSDYRVYTVEDNPKWIKELPNVTYIKSPLVKYAPFFSKEEVWYDPEILANKLPVHYDAIIVDGPAGSTFSRFGFVEHLNLFNKVPVLFDDIHAPNVYMVMIETMNKWNLTKCELTNIVNDKAFAWIGL